MAVCVAVGVVLGILGDNQFHTAPWLLIVGLVSTLISKQIVEAHHGTIFARNLLAADGSVAGAVFTVRLPLRA